MTNISESIVVGTRKTFVISRIASGRIPYPNCDPVNDDCFAFVGAMCYTEYLLDVIIITIIIGALFALF